MENSHKTLYKSDDQKLVSGVASGLAEFLEVNPGPIRLIFMLLLFANGIGIIIYVVFALILPSEEKVNAQEDEAYFEGAYALRKQAEEQKKDPKPMPKATHPLLNAANLTAIVTVIVAGVLLTQEIVPWNLVGTTARTPLLALGIGLAIIVRSKRI